MKTYIGTKVVRAAPMTRGEYNAMRGWSLPIGEDPADAGYLVEYTDGGKANHPDFKGYISWSPADVFDCAYRAASPAAMAEADRAEAPVKVRRLLTDHLVPEVNTLQLGAVLVIDEPTHGANHDYLLPGLTRIQFQKGAVAEHGLNGVTQEVLLAVVIDRLRSFQAGPYPCIENSIALEHAEQALAALHQRTISRAARGVEGRSQA